MALQPRHKLAIAGALLGASMLPFAVQPHWHGPRQAEAPVLLLVLFTGGLGLWGALGGRAAFVLMLLRAGLQLLAMLLMLTQVSSYHTHGDFLRAQAGVSLGLTVATLWLLLTRAVRAWVWGNKADAAANSPVRPASRLGTRGVLFGMAATAVVVGGIEQTWLYGHSSGLELGLRGLYLMLPWAGAWQLARLGRDRVVWTTLGALLGELASELVSLVVSGAGFETVVLKLMLPLTNLPALLVGLALAVLGPRRPLWQLGLALPLAQLGYRAATVLLTTAGGRLSLPDGLLAVAGGLGCAAAIYRFRGPQQARSDTAEQTT
jgi:hypothetical protein